MFPVCCDWAPWGGTLVERDARVVLCVESLGELSHQRAEDLRKAGYTVVLTDDPQDALATFISRKFDAVLLDIRLGNTKKKSLRSAMNSIRPRVPIVGLCPAGFRSNAARSLFEHVFRDGKGNAELISILEKLF